jgi:preprotein translocase subunit YajC
MLFRLAGTALFADGPPATGVDELFHFVFPIVMILALLYFVVLRPQRREQAKQQAMLAELKKNDRVLTAGGIFGVVTNVHREANEVTIKVDETTNTKLRVTLGSITRVLGDEPSDEAPKT